MCPLRSLSFCVWVVSESASVDSSCSEKIVCNFPPDPHLDRKQTERESEELCECDSELVCREDEDEQEKDDTEEEEEAEDEQEEDERDCCCLIIFRCLLYSCVSLSILFRVICRNVSERTCAATPVDTLTPSGDKCLSPSRNLCMFSEYTALPSNPCTIVMITLWGNHWIRESSKRSYSLCLFPK